MAAAAGAGLSHKYNYRRRQLSQLLYRCRCLYRYIFIQNIHLARGLSQGSAKNMKSKSNELPGNYNNLMRLLKHKERRVLCIKTLLMAKATGVSFFFQKMYGIDVRANNDEIMLLLGDLDMLSIQCLRISKYYN